MVLLLAGCSGGGDAPQDVSTNAPAPTQSTPAPTQAPSETTTTPSPSTSPPTQAPDSGQTPTPAPKPSGPSNTPAKPITSGPAPAPAVPGKYNGSAFLDIANLKLEGIKVTLVPQTQQQAAITITNGQRVEDAFFDAFWEERTVRAGATVASSSPSLFQVAVELAPGPENKTSADAWVERSGWVQAGDEGGTLTISIPYGLAQSEFLQVANFHAFASAQLIFGEEAKHSFTQQPGTQQGVLSITRTLKAGERVDFNVRTQTASDISPPPAPAPED